MSSNAALLTNQIPDDVTGWWASEKYDGVRAIWTGEKLISRQGKTLNAPESFTRGLPRGVRLDGELWMGPGNFDKLRSAIQTKGGDWNCVFFMVFDLVDAGSFEDRYEALKRINLPPTHVFVVKHSKLTGNRELDMRERAIVNCGGEGVVIRRPGSRYRPGRAGDVIKVKRLVADVDRWQG